MLRIFCGKGNGTPDYPNTQLSGLLCQKILNRTLTLGLTHLDLVFLLHTHNGEVFRQHHQFRTGIHRPTNQAPRFGEIGTDIWPRRHLNSCNPFQGVTS